MTDVIENETAPEADAAPAEATKTPRVKKDPVLPHVCLCSRYLLRDEQDKDTEIGTECTSTTLRTFAQGHDARLVSFLVQGVLDGYTIWKWSADKSTLIGPFENPAHAVGDVSNALQTKAEKATDNAKATEKAKVERRIERETKRNATAAEKAERKEKAAAAKAEKVAAAEKKQAEVKDKVKVANAVADIPLDPKVGDALVIKAGRGEYEADVIDVEGVLSVRYQKDNGDVEVRPIDVVRVLKRVA